MAHRLPALYDTFKRQTRAGNLVLILMAVWLIFPYTNDKLRGIPFISSELSFMYDDTKLYIRDNITIKYPNSGNRSNIIIDEDNKILCTKNWNYLWDKSQSTVWNMDAFVGCEAPDRPFKVCSVFSVNSRSGIERKFGGGLEFCTGIIDPNVVRERYGT